MIGFTGTQKGMTRAQMDSFIKGMTWALNQSEWVFSHGDCIGSDDQAATAAYAMGFVVICHPPIKANKRAFNPFYQSIKSERDYLDRDRDIVDNATRLFATPSGHEPEPRSGTWYTIRYADTLKIPIYIIFPDGKVQMKNAIDWSTTP